MGLKCFTHSKKPFTNKSLIISEVLLGEFFFNFLLFFFLVQDYDTDILAELHILVF